MLDIYSKHKSLLFVIAIILILQLLIGCSSTKYKIYESDHFLIVDPHPQVDNISAIFTKNEIIVVDSSYWKRDRLVYYDRESKKKNIIRFTKIETLRLNNGRNVVLIPRDLENITYVQSENCEFTKPQETLYVGDSLLLVKETKGDNDFRSVLVSEIEILELSYKKLDLPLTFTGAALLMPVVMIAIYIIAVSSTEHPFGY